MLAYTVRLPPDADFPPPHLESGPSRPRSTMPLAATRHPPFRDICIPSLDTALPRHALSAQCRASRHERLDAFHGPPPNDVTAAITPSSSEAFPSASPILPLLTAYPRLLTDIPRHFRRDFPPPAFRDIPIETFPALAPRSLCLSWCPHPISISLGTSTRLATAPSPLVAAVPPLAIVNCTPANPSHRRRAPNFHRVVLKSRRSR